uniref:Secreted protein n=1 Tax=Amblyomma americanum TaxID=6943 RepID=A0A0C9SEG0_AMBAM
MLRAAAIGLLWMLVLSIAIEPSRTISPSSPPRQGNRERRFKAVSRSLVTAPSNAANEVDLYKQVEYYLKSNYDEIKSWSLTENYTYWRIEKKRNEHPIRAKLENWKCENGRNFSNGLNPSVCRDQFIWKIDRSMRCPFPLYVDLNMTVIYNNTQAPDLLRLDLTNRTLIVWEPQGNNKTNPRSNLKQLLQESCTFSTTATFQGQFAYQLKRPRGDHHGYYSVGVERLQNESVGLHKNGYRLEYQFTGFYTHSIICEEVNSKA